jgi:NAD(P)-dependent dehydrogenase (short-subunit alcohol dehydrogenase family)
MPIIGFYSVSKWAIEALHECLAQEVKSFGIKVTIIEPGAYATEFGAVGSTRSQEMEIYRPLRQRFMENVSTMERGNPNATAEAILNVADAANPPLRLILGDQNLPRARAAYAERLATLKGPLLASHKRG